MSLPEYVRRNLGSEETPSMLRTPAVPVTFPLSEQDFIDIVTLTKKYDSEASIAGLAAVQIGISKRIIIFATPEKDKDLAIWRPDLTDSMPKTLWINPEFTGLIEDGKHEDYEGCFSVEGVAGLVPRFKTINYTALLSNGDKVEGIVRGYLARIIQHEIDHLNGVLFTDIAVKDSLVSMEEYKNMRLAAIERGYR